MICKTQECKEETHLSKEGKQFDYCKKHLFELWKKRVL